MANAFVVINAGSTSVKFAAYTGDDADSLDLVCRGQLDGIGSQPRFAAKNAKGELIDTQTWDKERPLDREDALKFVLTWLERHEAGLEIVAVGHRVVLGGAAHERPTLVDEKVLGRARATRADRAVAPAIRAGGHPCGGKSVSPTPASRGLRHVVSSHHA